jgi:hypothetical protein
MVEPIQRVNVDVTAGMLEELERAAQDLNVSCWVGASKRLPCARQMAEKSVLSY